jgi:NCS1 family nucleobase:cation symporter-1
MVVTSAGEALYGTLFWDSTTLIALWPTRAGAFFLALSSGLATLDTNISANFVATSTNLRCSRRGT